MSDAPDNAALLAELRKISAQLNGGRWLDRWFDRRSIIPAFFVAAITFGGGWLAWHDDIRDLKNDRDAMQAEIKALKERDTSGISTKVDSAINSSTQNAGEIRRVEQDSKDRDVELRKYIDASMQYHEKWAHRDRRTMFSAPPGGPSWLPLLSTPGAVW